jgi:hypothetical protein
MFKQLAWSQNTSIDFTDKALRKSDAMWALYAERINRCMSSSVPKLWPQWEETATSM